MLLLYCAPLRQCCVVSGDRALIPSGRRDQPPSATTSLIKIFVQLQFDFAAPLLPDPCDGRLKKERSRSGQEYSHQDILTQAFIHVLGLGVVHIYGFVVISQPKGVVVT